MRQTPKPEIQVRSAFKKNESKNNEIEKLCGTEEVYKKVSYRNSSYRTQDWLLLGSYFNASKIRSIIALSFM